MRRITFEEFFTRATAIHGNEYEYEKDSYCGMKKKLWMIHKSCGTRFQQTAQNHVNGQGCPVCGKEYARTYRQSDYRRFLNTAKARFAERYEFPFIEDEYTNSHSKITVKCKHCGNTYIKIACDFLTSETGGCWCTENECDYITFNNFSEKYSAFTIKPFEGKKHIRHDRVSVHCNKCGCEYDVPIIKLINEQYKCARCAKSEAGKKRLTPASEVRDRLKSIFPTVTPDMSTYTNINTKMAMRCDICGHTFKRSPNAVFSKTATTPCPKCTKEETRKKRTKTTEQFSKQINERYGEGEYEVLSPYVGSKEYVLVRHNKCNREFRIEANSFLHQYGCPYHHRNKSIHEEEIADYISSLGETVLTNDRSILGGYELDVYLPDRKIAFEFDGVFWHNEFNKPKDYHLTKTEKCAEKGIRLIHIFEDEWNDRREIWKSMIQNILGHTEKRIYARVCKICEVDARECNEFLEKNHLQGKCGSSIKIGLRFEDKLVSVMTFGKSRHFIGNGKTEWELLRYCSSIGVNVVGGASKLFKSFIADHHPNEIVSYADRRWSTGHIYDVLGFEFSHFSKPNYFYVIKDKRINRFNLRKSVLKEKYGCPDDTSEREFCKQMGWARIYDCGTIVFKWFKKN